MKDNKRIPTTYAKCFNTLSEAEDYYLKWEKTAVAYTDGSYSPDRGKYSYGVAIYNAGGEYHLSGRPNDPDMAKFANLAGEAEAVAMAVSFCKDRGVEKLTVFHDFDQLPGWARGEHPTLPVAARLHKSCAASGVDLSFVKVKAHSSNKGNFKADALAKSVLLPRRAYS